MTTDSQAPATTKDHELPMGKLGQTIHDYGEQRGVDYVEPGAEGAVAVECMEVFGAWSSCETNPKGPTGD